MQVYTATSWCARVALSGSASSKAALLIDKDHQDTSLCARLFISGDRSQVGKSSCCLGILASLVDRLGYKPDEVAYIKPATQCEAPQLVTRFCEARSIEVADPAVVYFSGFTREFLEGNTKTTEEMVRDIELAVEKLCSKAGRKIVIVDGVGYPAVGSIVGLSNAVVAKASKAAVVLISPKGVGNAVDSYNLNSTFFSAHDVEVLGGIFNRFPLEGFYSIDKCEKVITSYFTQYQPNAPPYGFLPELPSLIGASPPPAPSPSKGARAITAATTQSVPSWSAADDAKISSLLEAFQKYAQVDRLVRDLLAYNLQGNKLRATKRFLSPSPSKPVKKSRPLSREEIMARATQSGAASGG